MLTTLMPIFAYTSALRPVWRHFRPLMSATLFSGFLNQPNPALCACRPTSSAASKSAFAKRSERINSAFNDLTANQPFVAEWRNITSERGDPEAIIASHGRTADLILASQSDPELGHVGAARFPRAPRAAERQAGADVPNGDRPATASPRRSWWPGTAAASPQRRIRCPALPAAGHQRDRAHRRRNHTASGTALPDVELAANLARHGVKLTVSKLKPGKHRPARPSARQPSISAPT